MDDGGPGHHRQVRRIRAGVRRVHEGRRARGGGPAPGKRHGGVPAGEEDAAGVPRRRGPGVPAGYLPRGPAPGAQGSDEGEAEGRLRRRRGGAGAVRRRRGRCDGRADELLVRGEERRARPDRRHRRRVLRRSHQAPVHVAFPADGLRVPERPHGDRGGAGGGTREGHARRRGGVRAGHEEPMDVSARCAEKIGGGAAVQGRGVRRGRRRPGDPRVAGTAADAKVDGKASIGVLLVR
mmetsp:Transcript_11999/g.50455  ORF Transcript_11999/g.50455 Transcript_11999/m.50455 type:complete len:237 (-) Transcript_11999:637-1347(-)